MHSNDTKIGLPLQCYDDYYYYYKYIKLLHIFIYLNIAYIAYLFLVHDYVSLTTTTGSRTASRLNLDDVTVPLYFIFSL